MWHSGACGSKQGGHPTSCGLDLKCSKRACDDNTCAPSLIESRFT